MLTLDVVCPGINQYGPFQVSTLTPTLGVVRPLATTHRSHPSVSPLIGNYLLFLTWSNQTLKSNKITTPPPPFIRKVCPNPWLEFDSQMKRTSLTSDHCCELSLFKSHLHTNLLSFNADDLVKACHITVVGVGKDWTNLYYTLLFNPSRQMRQRNEDVQGNNYKITW